MGFQPFTVPVGIVILREGVLERADIKGRLGASVLEPFQHIFQIVRDLLPVIHQIPPAVHVDRLEHKKVRLVHDIAKVLPPVAPSAAQSFQRLLRIRRLPTGSSGFLSGSGSGFLAQILIGPSHAAQNRHAHPALVVLQLPCNAPDLRRAGEFHLGQKIDEMLFPAPAQTGLLLVLFILEHGFHGHSGDQRNVVDLVRIPRDADDAFFMSVVHDRHINARLDARKHSVVPDYDHVLISVNDAVRHLVIGTDSPRIPAGNDHSLFVHDIDVVFRVLRDLLNKPARQFRFDHSCLLILFTSPHE